MTHPAHPLPLETRTGLPDALRILVEQYPRDIWQAHDNFDGLVKFWMERHLMFRRLVTRMRDDIEQREARTLDPEQHIQRLARFGSMFVGELHMHHNIEDTQYFPVLQKMETRLVHGFEILDRDHHALDIHLEAFTQDANLLMKDTTDTDRQAIDVFHRRLERMEGFLDRHLTDEEELVVPVILKHGFEH